MKKLSNSCQRLGARVVERECFGDDETALHTDCGGSYKLGAFVRAQSCTTAKFTACTYRT